jgi:hypothetical protein
LIYQQKSCFSTPYIVDNFFRQQKKQSYRPPTPPLDFNITRDPSGKASDARPPRQDFRLMAAEGRPPLGRHAATQGFRAISLRRGAKQAEKQGFPFATQGFEAISLRRGQMTDESFIFISYI